MKTYGVVCHHCRQDLTADGEDLVCPGGHEDSRLTGALATLPTFEPPEFVCMWDGRRNLAGGTR